MLYYKGAQTKVADSLNCLSKDGFIGSVTFRLDHTLRQRKKNQKREIAVFLTKGAANEM